MIEIEKLVPEIYKKDSRDFQLFCKLLELVVNSVNYNATNISNVTDPIKCQNSMLDLLCTMFNYQPKYEPTDEDLRTILSNYSYLIRHRGSILGIKQAISMALKLNNKSGDYRYAHTNMVNSSLQPITRAYDNNGVKQMDDKNSFKISVGVTDEVNTHFLKEFIDVVKPIGYIVNIEQIKMAGNTSKVGVIIDYEGDLQQASEFEAVPSSTDVDTQSANATEINRQEIIRSDEQLWEQKLKKVQQA